MTSDVAMLAEARRLLERGTRVAWCTVVEKRGSGPRGVGTKMVVAEGGTTYGTIGGGPLEQALVEECGKALRERTARTVTFDMTRDAGPGTIPTGLICGGQMAVFIDVLEPDSRLIIVGSGHVAESLARLADVVGLSVTVVGDAAQQATDKRFPHADRIVTGDVAAAIGELEVRPDDFVVIAHGAPDYDYTALKVMAEKKPAYIGLLGSRTKVAHLLERLRSDGTNAEDLTTLHAPVGVPIGAQTPEEIGISILAEVIQHKRERTRRDARPHS